MQGYALTNDSDLVHWILFKNTSLMVRKYLHIEQLIRDVMELGKCHIEMIQNSFFTGSSWDLISPKTIQTQLLL